MAACATLLAIAAAPASAVIVRLPDGHYLSYMRIARRNQPHPRRAISQARSCTTCDSVRHSVDYGGGFVMPSSTNYVIAWIPQGYSGAPFQDLGYDSGLDASNCARGGVPDSCGYLYGIAQYFKDLAAASGQNTNSNSVATQYNDGFGHTAAYNVQLAPAGNGPNGVYLDTDPLPGGGSGCPVAATSAQGGDASGQGGFCVTDAQVRTELNSYLTAHGLPRGLTNEYFLLTPPDVVTCLDQQALQCSGNAPITSAGFCGYHSAAGPTSSTFLYAQIPDSAGKTTSGVNDGVSGCDPFAGDGDCATTAVCNYNANFGEGSLSAVAHEQIESLTDPIPPTGWNNDEENPPTPTDGAEIGDLCNNDQASDPATSLQPDGSGGETPFNYTINGDRYWLQMEYSNQGATCAHAIVPDAPPNSRFSISGRSGNDITFNATGSCASSSCLYVWQFGDNQSLGELGGLSFTVTCPGDSTCRGAQISHTFPGTGSYAVALTVQAPNGRSWGVVHSVEIFAPLVPHVTTAGVRLAGAPVQFNASGTEHDRSLVITGYAWSFGDGSTGTGVRPSHVYARAGHYTFTLTVTDSGGDRVTRSATITIAPSCHVPNVVGMSLVQARSTLRVAHCALGHVKRPAVKRAGKRLVVAGQAPAAGRLVRVRTPVNLTLAYR